MFNSKLQLERFERGMRKREYKDEVKFRIKLFLIVVVFVAILDIGYRLSFII